MCSSHRSRWAARSLQRGCVHGHTWGPQDIPGGLWVGGYFTWDPRVILSLCGQHWLTVYYVLCIFSHIIATMMSPLPSPFTSSFTLCSEFVLSHPTIHLLSKRQTFSGNISYFINCCPIGGSLFLLFTLVNNTVVNIFTHALENTYQASTVYQAYPLFLCNIS